MVRTSTSCRLQSESPGDIGDGRNGSQEQEEHDGPIRRTRDDSSKPCHDLRRKGKQRGSHNIERQQYPDEPRRSGGPVTQGAPLLPASRDARRRRRQEVCRIVGQRRDNGGGQHEGQPEAQQAIAQEDADSFARDAVLHKQTRQEKHERHEENVIEASEE